MLDFSFRRNRAVDEILRAARARVIERLQSRHPMDPASMIAAAGLPAAAADVLTELAGYLRVSAGQLRMSDRLSDLAQVPRTELPGIDDETWRTSKFGNAVQPFAYDIMWLAESRTPAATWREYYRRLSPAPRNEEEWIDHVMQLRVAAVIALASGASHEPPCIEAPAL